MNAMTCRLLLWALVTVFAAPSQAAKPGKAAPALTDLAVRTQKHGLACPLPKAGPCVIKKPVGASYRVLTPGANLEDMGNYWLADFAKIKEIKVNRLVLRVLDDDGVLHEIEARFPADPAAKEKSVAKEPEKPKEAPKDETKDGEANK